MARGRRAVARKLATYESAVEVRPRRTVRCVGRRHGRHAGSALDRSFVDYCRGECHLAENTVAAYGATSTNFPRGWRRGRFNTHDPRPGRLSAGCTGANWPRQHRPAYRVAEGLLPLLAVGRRAARQPGRVAGQPEALGAGAQGAQLEQIDRLFAAPGRTDPCWRRDRALLELLYATGCRASEAFEPPTARHAPRRGLLHLPRQGRQGATGAAWARGRSQPSGPISNTSGRRLAARSGAPPRLGCCCRIAGGDCGASGFGNC